MSVMASLCMFFLSFTPLWLSVLFVNVMSIVKNAEFLYTEWISILSIGILFIISLIVLSVSLDTKKRMGAQKYCIVNVVEEKTITAEYLLSYILPLFAFDFTIWSQVVLFLIYFLTLGYLYIKYNYLSVNIVLELMCYRSYRCELENEDKISVSRRIISKEQLINHKNETISIRPLNNEFSLDLLDWKIAVKH